MVNLEPEFSLKLNKILKSVFLEIVAEECERIENLRPGMGKIEERDTSKIDAVKQKQHKEKIARKINPCYGCGHIRYYKECPFRRNEYFNL